MQLLIWVLQTVLTSLPCGALDMQSRTWVIGVATEGQLFTMQLKNDSSVIAPCRQSSVSKQVVEPVPMYVAAVP